MNDILSDKHTRLVEAHIYINDRSETDFSIRAQIELRILIKSA